MACITTMKVPFSWCTHPPHLPPWGRYNTNLPGAFSTGLQALPIDCHITWQPVAPRNSTWLQLVQAMFTSLKYFCWKVLHKVERPSWCWGQPSAPCLRYDGTTTCQLRSVVARSWRSTGAWWPGVCVWYRQVRDEVIRGLMDWLCTATWCWYKLDPHAVPILTLFIKGTITHV